MVGGEWMFHSSKTHETQPLTTTSDLTKGFNLQGYNNELARFKKACNIFLKEYGKGIIVRWSTVESVRKDNVFATFSYFCNKHSPSGPAKDIGMPSEETLKPGTLVEVHNLLEKKNLNGEKGVTEEFASTPGRIGVRLFDNSRYALKARNLKVIVGFTHSWTLYVDPRKQQSMGTNLNADCNPLFGVDFTSFKVFCFTFQYHLSRKFGFYLSLANGLRGTDPAYSFISEGPLTYINGQLYRTVEDLNSFLNLDENAKNWQNNMIMWQNAKKWHNELFYVATTTGNMFAGKAQHEQWCRMILEWFPSEENDNSPIKKPPSAPTVTGNEPEIIDLSDSEDQQQEQVATGSVPPVSTVNSQPSTSSIKMVNIQSLINPSSGTPSQPIAAAPPPYPFSNPNPMSASEQFLSGHSIFGPSLPSSSSTIPSFPTQATSTPAVSGGQRAPKPTFEGASIPRRNLFRRSARQSDTNINTPTMGTTSIKLIFELPINKRVGFAARDYQMKLNEVVRKLNLWHENNSGVYTGLGYKITLNGPNPANNIFAVISYGCQKHVVRDARFALPGTLVQVKNLSKKPHLNGKRGTIQTMIDASSGRLNVYLDIPDHKDNNPNKVYALKPENIQVVEFMHTWTLYWDPTVNMSNPTDIRYDCIVSKSLDYGTFLRRVQGLQQIFVQRFGFRTTVPIKKDDFVNRATSTATKRPGTTLDNNEVKRSRFGTAVSGISNQVTNKSPIKSSSVIISPTKVSNAHPQRASPESQNQNKNHGTILVESPKATGSKQASPEKGFLTKINKDTLDKVCITIKEEKVEASEKSSATKKSSSSRSANSSSEKDKTSVVDVSEDTDGFKSMYDKVKQRHGDREKIKVEKDPDLEDFRDEKTPERKLQQSKEDEMSKLKRKLEKYQTRLKRHKEISKRYEELEKVNTQLKKKLSRAEQELAEKEKQKGDTTDCMKEANNQIRDLRITISELRGSNEKSNDASSKKIEQLERELKQSRENLEESMKEIKRRDEKISRMQKSPSKCGGIKTEGDEDLEETRRELEKLKSKMGKMKDLLKIKEKEIDMYKSMASDSDDDDHRDAKERRVKKEEVKSSLKAIKCDIKSIKCEVEDEDENEVGVNQKCDEDIAESNHDNVDNNPFENVEISAVSIKQEPIDINDSNLNYLDNNFENEPIDEKDSNTSDSEDNNLESEPIESNDSKDNNFESLEITAVTVKQEPETEPIIAPAPKTAKYFNPDFDEF